MSRLAPQSARFSLVDFLEDAPLVGVTRGTVIGSLHRGSFSIRTDDGSPVFEVGDANAVAFLRSAAKPFQVLPAILAGAVDRFALTEAELAILCASHNGEDRHVAAVHDVLEKLGLDVSALHCGVHPPMHSASSNRRLALGLEPTPFCHNCSGSHAGMLAACVANGWPIETYGQIDHPLQRQIRTIVAAYAGLSPDEVVVAEDNCNVPTFGLSLAHAATAFARLWSGDSVSSELAGAGQRAVRAMAAYPEMIAGDGRFDTALTEITGGNIVAKGGAEGYQGVIVRGSNQGLALKISDGATRAVAPAVVHALSKIGALDQRQIEALAPYAHPVTRDRDDVAIGTLEPLFG